MPVHAYTWNPYSIPFFAIGLLSLVAGIILRRHRQLRGHLTTSLLCLACGAWAFCQAMELMVATLPGMILWSKLQFLGMAAIPVLSYLLALQYSAKSRRLHLHRYNWLLLVPLATLVLVFTNEFHGLIWREQHLAGSPPLRVLDQSYGLGFLVFLAYALALLGGATFPILRTLPSSTRLSRRRILAMTAVMLLTFAAFAIDPADWVFDIYARTTEVGVWAFTLVGFWSLKSLQEGTLSLSSNALLDHRSEPIIVVDMRWTIMDLNPAAELALGSPCARLRGINLNAIQPGIVARIDQPEGTFPSPVELRDKQDYAQYAVVATPLLGPDGDQVGRAIALRDVSALERERSAARRLTAISAATSIMHSSLNIAEVLAMMAEEMGKAVSATSAYICTYDRASSTSCVVAEYHSPDFSSPEKALSLGETIDLHSRFPGEIENLEAGIPSVDHVDDPANQLQKTEPHRGKSVITIPLQTKGETTAYAQLWESGYRREFSREDVDLCMAVAGHAAIAIENARLHSETEKRLGEQISLRKAMEAIASEIDLDNMLSRIAEQLCVIVRCTSAYICGWDEGTKGATVLAEYYADGANELERVSDIGQTYFFDGPEFIGRMKQGLPDILHLDDPEISAEDKNHLEQYGGQSVVYIPLLVHGELLAFAELWNSSKRRGFSREEVGLAMAVARLAGVAIHNARLYERTLQEISERKSMEERLTHNAFHDDLTGLPNRALLIDRLEQTLAAHKRRKHGTYALLFLDLDRFKIVNDSLGHFVGDGLLVAVGARLKASLREEDTLARIGGDEFVILLRETGGVVDASRVATRILEMLREGFDMGGTTVYTSGSIGIVMGDERYESPQELLRDADIAMYRAKDAGRNRCAVFDKQMHETLAAVMKVEDDLRSAISNRELELFFQPIVSLADSRLVGAEALMRWNHPQRGLIYPGEFMPVAEESGLIVEMDLWAIADACRQMQSWVRSGRMDTHQTMSVNISGQTLETARLLGHVKRTIEQTGLDPRCLVLEIVERAILQDVDAATKTLAAIKELGVRIHLDDFGSGQSSLNVLRRLPIDAIKIDRSFVENVDSQCENEEIIRAIVHLAKGMKKGVIAEGIETQGELEMLQEIECFQGQGYWFSRPVDAPGMQHFIDSLLDRTHPLQEALRGS